MWIIVSDDEKHEFTFDSLTATEGIALKKKAGIPNRRALTEGLNDDDPETWQAVVWLLRARKAIEDGQPTPRFSDTEFPWGTCRIEFTDDEMNRIREGMRAIEEARDAGEPEPVVEPVADERPTVESPST